MSRAVSTLTAILVVFSVSIAASARAGRDDSAEFAIRRTLVSTEPSFRSSLARIAQGSPLFRQAVERLRSTDGRIFVVTPEQFRSMAFADDEAGAADASLLAEATPLLDADARVRSVVVVVNLPLLEQAHYSKGSLEAELQSDLDRILVHEIYGHAVPYLEAGNLSGRCADPQPGERPSEACSIRRENDVRAELRLGRRTDSGLEGLILSRRMR